MFYSAYDKQNNRYFDTGKNSNSKVECLESIIEFLDEENEFLYHGDNVYNDQQGNGWSGEDIINIYEVEIHEHKEEI